MIRASAMSPRVCVCALAASLLVGVIALASPAPAAEGDPWSGGANWISVRGGYAKSGVEGAPNGIGGYGFGFQHFLSTKWAVGGHVHHELLGRFGSASEIAIPFTAEISRHFKWPTSLRPYLALGAGAFFHKMYRTGTDGTQVRNGGYVSGGFNAVISDRSLLGVDWRMALETDAKSTNPAFPSTTSSATLWSAKLSYSRFF
ncbi:MAG TPA: hypothetical protein VEY91_00375 [Candidatus Limnocylindria bacterium]|nr:hypothetical protein [Candidatus Limnocylindria bacterium]